MTGQIRRITDLEREQAAEIEQLKAELARVRMQSVLVWIRPNHLQMARRGPFICRLRPDRLDGDWVPLFAAPKAG